MIFGGRSFVAAAGLVVAATRPSVCASLTDRPLPFSLQRDVGCMVRTLSAMPEIDLVESSVARYGGMPQATVQYRDRSKAGHGATIRFEMRGLEPPFQFQTAVSGLSTAGKAPDDYGTNRIERAWKANCKVNAATFFD